MLSTKEMSIIITGGCSGLGFGMAKRFSSQGAKVTICGRREDKVKDAKEILGDNVSAIVADITKNSDRKKLIQAGLDHGGKINALVNNAGNMYRGAIDNLDQNELINILWTDEDSLSSHQFTWEVRPFQHTYYYINITNEEGCSATDTTQILVNPAIPIYIPNAFSPNGDQINDEFTIYAGLAVERINTFQVYNRWGALLFENFDFAHKSN